MRRYVLLRSVIAAYQQQYADNQNISFLPAIVSTSSTRMHGEFFFFFYRPTGRLRHTSLPLECRRKPTTRKHSRFKRAAFYNGLKR